MKVTLRMTEKGTGVTVVYHNVKDIAVYPDGDPNTKSVYVSMEMNTARLDRYRSIYQKPVSIMAETEEKQHGTDSTK